MSQELRKARATPVNRIPASMLPAHEATQVSRQNLRIEKSLMTELNRFVNAIRSELDKTPDLQWTRLRAILIPRLYNSVFQVMRSHISQSYELGANYITDRVGLSNASFLTHSDIDNIKALAGEFTNKFFGRIQLSLDATIRKSFASPQQAPDSSINPNFISTSVAISASSKALAEGTRLKAKSLIDSNAEQAVLSAATTTTKKKKRKKPAAAAPAPVFLDEEEMIDDLMFGLAGGFAGATALSLASLAGQQLEEQQLVWVTAEDPCFEICAPLEGEVFSMDDIDIIPQPIDDTHPNCRCRLLLL